MTKQHILSEIQRIAVANGGKSPGRLAFYNQTSIKENDWMGKYWPRWNDAIREAGLEPNKMTAGYEEDFLMDKLISLAREVGHIPVSGELRLKAFNDKSFPSMTTFENRFGSKAQQISKIADFCRKNSGFEDVLSMCEQISGRAKGEAAAKEESQTDDQLGFVYLIKSGRFYKIGKTNSIGRREYDLAIQLAEKPTTIHTIKTDDPDGVESYWHRRFAAKRKGGEWFDLNAADVKAFKRWLRIA